MRRAPRACTFCRRRKLKCDNNEPSCANCTAYGKECQYITGPKRPRPSYSRISHLEEENLQLRRQLLSQGGPNASRPSREFNALSDPDRLPSEEHHDEGAKRDQVRSTVSRIFISPNGDSSYHGLTSTLFDDAPTDRHVVTGIAGDPTIPVEYMSKRLTGEAAIQRQLEPLNFQQGKLDFDGVDPELGMHLLSLHWNRQHHSFLITYRPAFMRDMACGGPYFSKLLLNAIYFGASKFSNRPEVRRSPDEPRTAGWTFRMRVKELLGDALDRSEITTIQALLVMSSSLFALGDERSAAWLYAGTAFRMIIDLGMHVDATMLRNMRRLSDEDLDIRRRVFWGAFVVDKIQSLYQGRPASLQAFDSQVPLTFLDQYEELEHWQPFAYSGGTHSYPGSSAYSLSTFTALCKLSVILNSILNKVYSERSSKDAPAELISIREALDSQLNTWHSTLPDHLRFCPSSEQVIPVPHILSLTALYNVLLILLHRPFVAEGHLHTANPSVAFESFAKCATAATNITDVLKAYDKAFSIRRAPYLISYATYVAATIHARVAAQREEGSSAHVSLGTCLAVFDENMETNWAVRRAKNVIVHLMDRMGVSLDRGQDPQRSRMTPWLPSRSSAIDGTALMPGVTANDQAVHMFEPSGFDMDMIIQSFIRQQGGNDLEQPAPWPRDVASSNYSGVILPMERPETQNSMLDLNFDQQDMRLDEDMLFGFNGSLLDGIP